VEKTLSPSAIQKLFKGILLCCSATTLIASIYVLISQSRNSLGDIPISVPVGTHEIAWLAPSNSSVTWQRFVEAVLFFSHSNCGQDISIDSRGAFPSNPRTIPAIKFTWKSRSLIWSWYRTDDEYEIVGKLITRFPQPIAIIGGASTESAIKLATAITKDGSPNVTDRPVMILTTATANHLRGNERNFYGRENLMTLHKGLSFRFGFSNYQMATLILDFLKEQNTWSGPLPAPWIMRWVDDPYATDLEEAIDSAWRSLPEKDKIQKGFSQIISIKSSVGGLQRPNSDELLAASNFASRAIVNSNTEGNWLALCGQLFPSRRLLKTLAQFTDSRLKGYTIISGDTLGFNTVYRDWEELWPVKDLPFSVVFFCHQNPVSSEYGFNPNPPAEKKNLASGTDDLLLNRDLIQALTEAWRNIGEADNSATLASVIRNIKYSHDGPRFAPLEADFSFLFDNDGNRNSGSGEHIVTLSPSRLPRDMKKEGTVEVWSANGLTASSRFSRIRQLIQPVFSK